MQNPSRLLLALLAVVGSSAALAQSSVTLYGRVNTTVEHQKTGNDTVNGMFNNSSRFGFKGTEDPGVGTGWPGIPNSSGINFGRQSEVNLAGGFGMLRLGNFTPESYYASADYVSMHNHDTGSSSDALYYDPVWFGGLGTKNKIGYRTPDFGGLTVDASVNMHEKAAGSNDKNGYDLAANYNAGPLALGAGYSQWNSNKQGSLRALYTFGQFTVGGYYQRNDEDLIGTRNNFRLAGMYAMGASEFHLNVGRANSWSKVADSAATQYTLGYNYNLSKRTKVYGYYTRVNNGANATYNVNAGGQDFGSVAFGVRHNF